MPTGAGAQHPGMIDLSSGDAAAALEHFERGVTLAGQDPTPAVAVGNNRSQALQAVDRLPEALQVGQDALDLAQWEADLHRVAAIASQVADVLHDLGRDSEAMVLQGRWGCGWPRWALPQTRPQMCLLAEWCMPSGPLAFATQEARWVDAARISSSAQAGSRMPSTSSSEFSPEPDSAALM